MTERSIELLDVAQGATNTDATSRGRPPGAPHGDDRPMSRAVLAGCAVVIVVAGALALRANRATPELTSPTTTTGSVSSTVPDTEPPSVEVGGTDVAAPEPAFGVPVGFDIWVGGDTRITLVSPDRARETPLDVVGYPLFATDSTVVYRDHLAGRFRLLDRAEPTAPPRELPSIANRNVDAVAASSVADAVWLAHRSSDEGAVEWWLVSVATGAPLRSTTTSSIDTIRIADSIEVALGPEVEVRGEEVWRLGSDGHHWWFDGDVLARNEQYVLARRCEPECVVEWRSIHGDDPSRDTPRGLLDSHELVGSVWLYARADDLSESSLIHGSTSQHVDIEMRRTTRPFAIDPTDRFAVMTGSQRVWLLDLRSGDRTPLPGANRLVGVSSSVVLTAAN